MTLELNGQYKNGLLDPCNRFLYALKAPETKRQYPKRIEVFLNFIGICEGTIEERLMVFYEQSKLDPE